MINTFKRFIEEKKEQYRQKQLKKFYRLHSLLIGFYTEKGYEFTANLIAKARVEKLRSNSELNKWYRKMNRYNLAA